MQSKGEKFQEEKKLPSVGQRKVDLSYGLRLLRQFAALGGGLEIIWKVKAFAVATPYKSYFIEKIRYLGCTRYCDVLVLNWL